MTDCCTHKKEFLELEQNLLEKEFKKNQSFLTIKNHRKVSIKEAKEDYVKNYLSLWASGFAQAYCFYCCDPHKCREYNSKMANYVRKVKSHMKKLSNNLDRKVSFEEAERDYIFELGPSFWKGITDVFYLLKSGKINSCRINLKQP